MRTLYLNYMTCAGKLLLFILIWFFPISINAQSIPKIKFEGEQYVNLDAFCKHLECTVHYQWTQYKVFLKNPKNGVTAVLSTITKLALIDGQVLRLDRQILRQGADQLALHIKGAESLAALLGLRKLELGEYDSSIDSSRERGIQKNIYKVVLDAGHGGTDLGTKFGKVTEKEIALNYVLELRQALVRLLPETEILLTRTKDEFVGLPERAKFANENKADLFISIHVNHSPNKLSHGIETYILNPEATDDDARKLALLENESWLKSSELTHSDQPVLTKILIDLEQTRYIQSSAVVASLVQNGLAKVASMYGLKSRGVKQGFFYVLSQVAMPSTLVELGFLSNTHDRKHLLSGDFRARAIAAIAKAVAEYREVLVTKAQAH